MKVEVRTTKKESQFIKHFDFFIEKQNFKVAGQLIMANWSRRLMDGSLTEKDFFAEPGERRKPMVITAPQVPFATYPLVDKHCAWCGQLFTTRNPRRRFCGVACNRSNYTSRRNARNIEKRRAKI